MGFPKSLAVDADGRPWTSLATDVLRSAGCSRVCVILGARASEARRLLAGDIESIIVTNWAEGVSASIRAGLAAATGEAVLLTLGDLPSMPTTVAVRTAGLEIGPSSLRQAFFLGNPGHPVLIGRDHWEPMSANVRGDLGGRAYLTAHNVEEVECGDLWDGADVDHATHSQTGMPLDAGE